MAIFITPLKKFTALELSFTDISVEHRSATPAEQSRTEREGDMGERESEETNKDGERTHARTTESEKERGRYGQRGREKRCPP